MKLNGGGYRVGQRLTWWQGKYAPRTWGRVSRITDAGTVYVTADGSFQKEERLKRGMFTSEPSEEEIAFHEWQCRKPRNLDNIFVSYHDNTAQLEVRVDTPWFKSAADLEELQRSLRLIEEWWRSKP